MSHSDSHPLAGKTVKIDTLTIPGFGDFPEGREVTDGIYWVEDWQDKLFGHDWWMGELQGNPACIQYGLRRKQENLPDDQEVVYGKIANLGYILHVSELGEVIEKEG